MYVFCLLQEWKRVYDLLFLDFSHVYICKFIRFVMTFIDI